MAELQYKQWNGWKGGIDDTNQKPGGHYFAVGTDPYRKPNYLSVADRAVKDLDNNDDATFTEPIYWFEEIGGDVFALDSGGDLWKKDASTGWVASPWHSDGNAGAGQRLIEFDDELYWAANTTVGRVTTPTGSPGFTDSWKTGLTTASWHPMEKFLGKLFVGHGRNVASWDTATWVAQDLILPAGFVAKSMSVIGEFLAIGTVAPSGEDARIFLWDGTSATYNREVLVKATAVDALFNWSNTLFVVAGKAANLHYYNGATLQEIAKIADVDTDSGDSVAVRPGGIAHFKGRVLLAVNTISTLGDRIIPGVWAFDPTTGSFDLAQILSTGVMNTSGHAYSVFSDGTDFYVGGKDTNTGATSAQFVDKSGGSKYTESCYLTTQWFEDIPFADKHYRKFYLDLYEFPATGSTNEITIKYRVDDTTRRLNNGAEYTATAGAASTITVSSTSGITVGDELTVTGGPSAGDLRRITNVTATVLTVDRAFSATPVNAQTKFVVERWTEVEVVDATSNANATSASYAIPDAKGKKIQFKLELRDAETTGEEVSISSIALGYIQKKPI